MLLHRRVFHPRWKGGVRRVLCLRHILYIYQVQLSFKNDPTRRSWLCLFQPSHDA